MQTGGLYPGPRGSVAALSSQEATRATLRKSGAPGASISIYGTMVNAHTDTERARCEGVAMCV